MLSNIVVVKTKGKQCAIYFEGIFPLLREFSENDRFKNEGFEGYLFPVGWNFQKMKGLKTRDLKDFFPCWREFS